MKNTLKTIDESIKKEYNIYCKEGTKVTVREILKQLHADGWREVEGRTKGSHIQLKHPTKPGKVTIPAHGGDIPVGTLKSIKKTGGAKISPAAIKGVE